MVAVDLVAVAVVAEVAVADEEAAAADLDVSTMFILVRIAPYTHVNISILFLY